MKTPLYEISTGALQALLATREFFSVDLYTFTLAQGSVLRYAASDRSVNVAGVIYRADDCPIDLDQSQARAHWKIGTDVDSWTVHLMPRPVDPVTGAAFPDKINGTPWLTAARAGALDGATVTVDRAYFAAADLTALGGAMTIAPIGTLRLFSGPVAEIDLMDGKAIVTINSWMDRLTLEFPVDVYQPGCRAVLFGPVCGLSSAAYEKSGTVTAASGATLTVTVAAPGGSGTWAKGKMRITSGANAGFSRTIRSVSGSAFRLLAPFPFAIDAGTPAVLTPGCDKTRATCALFSNSNAFRGEPFIPAQETAI